MITLCLFTVYLQEHEWFFFPTVKLSECSPRTCKKDMVPNLIWRRHFLVGPGIAVLVPGIEGQPAEHCTDEDDPESQQIDVEGPEEVKTNQQMTAVLSMPKRKLVT